MHPEQADEQLQKDVQDELRRESALDVADISITVDRGVVDLEGHVSSASLLKMAEEIVRRVRGVRAVVDDLDVRPPGAAVDDELRIAREALEALDHRGGAPEQRIQVIVHDGCVRLEGTVDSPGEREAAEAAVGDVVLGWGTVKDAIVVRPRATSDPVTVGPEVEAWGEDDFDALRIDPRPGGWEAIEHRESLSRPDREGPKLPADAVRVNRLDE